MLTERQLLILQIIVNDFIESAQPVGSRSLSKKNDLNYSSATIRNEMADLEELGFIEKTHSSSGRVPSEKGYRYYVDHLLSPQLLSESDTSKLKTFFANRVYEIEILVQKSAQVLSELTNYTSIVLGPAVLENKLKRFQIIPLTKETAVLIIVTDTGHVEHRTISVPANIDASDLEKMVNILNERLVNVPLTELRNRIYKEVVSLLKRHIQNYDSLIHSFAGAVEFNQQEKIYLGGKTNMLRQPEFHDIHKITDFMMMFEEEERVYELIRNNIPKNQNAITVKIGKEIEYLSMEHCSLITASYSIGKENLWKIAAKVLSL